MCYFFINETDSNWCETHHGSWESPFTEGGIELIIMRGGIMFSNLLPGIGDKSGCTSTCAPSTAPPCPHLGPHHGSPHP